MTTPPKKRPSIAFLLYAVAAVTLGGYFAFASVQGDHGLFQRLQIEAELAALEQQSAALEVELSALRNKTLRLSDGYLDLDLLDEQARSVLGYVRADEVVIR